MKWFPCRGPRSRFGDRGVTSVELAVILAGASVVIGGGLLAVKDSTASFYQATSDVPSQGMAACTTGVDCDSLATSTLLAGGNGGVPGNSTPPPGRPINFTAIPGDGKVTLSWSQGSGGAPTSYQVIGSPGGYCQTPSTPGGTLSTACVITGLTNGTLYNFSVVAMNDIGDVSSPARTSATPIADIPPSAPVLSVSSLGDQQATLAWTASTGTAPITYTVSGATNTCSMSPCTVTGLTNNTTYTFTVTATNVKGSATSNSVTAKPGTAPGQPAITSVVAGDAQVTVTWSAPTTGSPVTGYTVAGSPGGTCPSTTLLTCTITGLTNNTAYTFTVTASNAYGSATSAVSSAVTPQPPVPGNVTSLTTATPASGSIKLSWGAPTTGGTPTNYDITWTGGSASVAFGTNTYTASGLTNGTSYTFTVKARNTGGSSSGVSASATPVLPVCATNLSVTKSGLVGAGPHTVDVLALAGVSGGTLSTVTAAGGANGTLTIVSGTGSVQWTATASSNKTWSGAATFTASSCSGTGQLTNLKLQN